MQVTSDLPVRHKCLLPVTLRSFKAVSARSPLSSWLCLAAPVTLHTFVATMMLRVRHGMLVFCFNHTSATEIYSLSLHDALPISAAVRGILRLLRVCVSV